MANASNLIAGPATVYVGDFGATEPTESEIDNAVGNTSASGAFADIGFTNGGVTVTHNQEFLAAEVDQIKQVPASWLVSRDDMFATNLAEPTLENLAFALNDGTAATGSGYKSYEPDYSGGQATQPTYRSLIVDGWGGLITVGGNSVVARKRLIVRKVLSVENVEYAYAKDSQTFLTVSWRAHWVDDSTPPWEVIEQTGD